MRRENSSRSYRRSWGGMTVHLGDGLTLPELIGTAPILASILPASAPITVRRGLPDASTAGPFVLIGASQPADSRPSVRFDRGAVTIAPDGQDTLFAAPLMAAMTVAQMIESGGNTGIWIRPGNEPVVATAATPVRLDRARRRPVRSRRPRARRFRPHG